MSDPWRREEIIGPCRLLLGDCREILPTLTGIDAVVSDPPYGIGFVRGDGGRDGFGLKTGRGPRRRNTGAIVGDDAPFDPAPLLALGVPCVLFGANHCIRRLPDGGTFHAWDKHCGRGVNDSFSDVEFIWENRKGKSRIVRYLWKGVLQDGEKGERKHHVSQKPIVVMSWCLDLLPPASTTICDPYMGSGSTAIACIRRGRSFVGIEIDERHFETARRRVERELAQGDMLRDAPSPPAEQTEWKFLGMEAP